MKQNISVVMVVYNEGKLIKRCLESVKDIANEIIIVHDGPCSDNTIEICKKYTKDIKVNKINIGLPGPLLPSLFKRAKGPWILKVDADEFLSQELMSNIKNLVQNKEADGYTFRWPWWDGNKYVTTDWPNKKVLYRKDKISAFGFPHWDDPKINGNVIQTDYQLHHQPIRKGKMGNWKDFVETGLKRYGRLQAEYTLKDFDTFDSFQWEEKDFTFPLRVKRACPLTSALPIGIIAFFKVLLYDSAWKQGKPVFIEAFQSIIYYLYVGYKIHELKCIKDL